MSTQGQSRVPITFHVTKGGEVIKTETLQQRVIKIGKSPSCTLQIEDDSVARTHAVVEVSGPGDVVLIATDENTFINGKQVNKGRLSSGDTVRLGAIELSVEIGRPEVVEPAPAPVAAAPVPVPAPPSRKAAPAPMMVAGVPIVSGPASPFIPGMGMVPGLEAEPEKPAAPQFYVDVAKYEDARYQIGEMISVWGGVVFNANDGAKTSESGVDDDERCEGASDRQPRDGQRAASHLRRAVLLRQAPDPVREDRVDDDGDDQAEDGDGHGHENRERAVDLLSLVGHRLRVEID